MQFGRKCLDCWRDKSKNRGRDRKKHYITTSFSVLCLPCQGRENRLGVLGGNRGFAAVAKVAGCYHISVAGNGGGTLRRVLKVG
jgi:hypothetical protein